ncbi:Larval cuticle protein 8 [Papilio machaon]|uniref:Larval cuticle protein 8 n=1 Tax=Papilio machaon TaxID=76193 RepID=A0A194R0N7_PAPMA|nr:Larval cuticle protein 8 [Papilio machaon]
MQNTQTIRATLFAFAALALVLAQEEPTKAPVEIVKQDSEVDVNGYNFEFETSDGTSRQEQGDYKNDTEQQGLSVKGSYRYIAPDGQHIQVTYVADKNGYQPIEEKATESSQS